MGLSDTINILKNPSSAGLINAFKISGRGEGNLAVGVFNAVTGNTYAKLQYPNGNEESILTEHATNYNILVLDQSMGKNSFVNFTNANVLRPGDNYWSNVTAAMFKIMDKTNKYCVSALGSFSTRNMSGANIDNGWYLDASLGKKNGTWVYEIGTQIISDDYNPNDLGYMTRFNQISNYAEIGYRRFSRFWIFNETMNTIDITHRSLFENASYVGANIHLTNYATTTKHLSIWNNLTIPLSDEYDYYEPRTEGKFYLRPSLINENFFISTDYRKRLAFDFRGGVYFDGIERHGYCGSISPLTRFGKRVSLRYQFSADYDLGAAGWVSNTNDDIIFGSRDVITFTNSFSSSIVFTNKLSLSLSARHYVSSVEYFSFYNLQEDGKLNLNNDYNGTSNYNFNLFNIDLLLSWNFLPGSYLSVMWKNQIFSNGDVPESMQMPTYGDSFKQIWLEPQANNLSVKLMYYIDYNSLFNQNFKNKK
ncbi:MAG: hypothetical protein C0596_01995 [Marinilabiliales bacterium]|nr:MAG: hypothetical protein C0596_01995 [Marinilabiliales bacterium]